MYTDDYVDENQEDEESIEEEQIERGNSSNTFKYILIIIMLIIILGLGVYLLYKNNVFSKKTDNYVLSLYPETLIIPFGKSQNVSYDLRNNGELVKNASVRITIADETIATIDNLSITGVSYGKTVLMASFVDDKGKTVQELKDVVVADGDKNISVTNISIPEGDLQIAPGGTYDIPLTIEPTNGYVENKVFTSSNSNVVTVDNKGTINVVGEGEATIIIDVNNGLLKKELKVYVKGSSEEQVEPVIVVRPSKITINKTITKMVEGESVTLTYTIEPENANKENLVWSSSDSKIIAVSENGTITAIGPGNATIKLESNDISDSVNIEVEKKTVPIESISLSLDEISMAKGSTQIIIPTVSPADATDKTLTYTSSDETIVKVTPNTDGATIEAINTGTATISIRSSNGIEKSVAIIVTESIESTISPTPAPTGGGECGSNKNLKCDAGKYAYCGKCVVCPSGSYCTNNTRYSCPAGKGSVKGAGTYQDCSNCAKGYYSTGNGKGCVACPKGKTTKSYGSTSKNDCNVDETVTSTPTPKPTNTPKPSSTPTSNKCKIGYYKLSGKCTICRKGYYCPDGITERPCGVGKTTTGTGSTSINACK